VTDLQSWVAVTYERLADVLAADLPARDERVRAWAQDVWEAYGTHHDRVRAWVDLALR